MAELGSWLSFLETKFLARVHCCVVTVTAAPSTAGSGDAVTIDLLLYTTISVPGDRQPVRARQGGGGAAEELWTLNSRLICPGQLCFRSTFSSIRPGNLLLPDDC